MLNHIQSLQLLFSYGFFSDAFAFNSAISFLKSSRNGSRSMSFFMWPDKRDILECHQVKA